MVLCKFYTIKSFPLYRQVGSIGTRVTIAPGVSVDQSAGTHKPLVVCG